MRLDLKPAARRLVGECGSAAAAPSSCSACSRMGAHLHAEVPSHSACLRPRRFSCWIMFMNRNITSPRIRAVEMCHTFCAEDNTTTQGKHLSSINTPRRASTQTSRQASATVQWPCGPNHGWPALIEFQIITKKLTTCLNSMRHESRIYCAVDCCFEPAGKRGHCSGCCEAGKRAAGEQMSRLTD